MDHEGRAHPAARRAWRCGLDRGADAGIGNRAQPWHVDSRFGWHRPAEQGDKTAHHAVTVEVLSAFERPGAAATGLLAVAFDADDMWCGIAAIAEYDNAVDDSAGAACVNGSQEHRGLRPGPQVRSTHAADRVPDRAGADSDRPPREERAHGDECGSQRDYGPARALPPGSPRGIRHGADKLDTHGNYLRSRAIFREQRY